MMRNRLLIAITTVFPLPSMNAPALAQQTPGAKINTDGMGFSRVAQGTRAAYDLVAAYDEHAIVEANCSTVKADVKGVSW